MGCCRTYHERCRRRKTFIQGQTKFMDTIQQVLSTQSSFPLPEGMLSELLHLADHFEFEIKQESREGFRLSFEKTVPNRELVFPLSCFFSLPSFERKKEREHLHATSCDPH